MPRLAGLRQCAEGSLAPILTESVVAAVAPGGIGADAGDTDKEIDVAHQFRKQHGIDVFERDGFPAGGHEAHLIRRQIIELEALLVHGRFDRLDPELDLKLTLGNALERPAIAGVPAAERGAGPAARLAQGAEAALLDDMAGKAVRIDVRGALGVGENIDFAVRLLERLSDLELRRDAGARRAHAPASDCIGCQSLTRALPSRDRGACRPHRRCRPCPAVLRPNVLRSRTTRSAGAQSSRRAAPRDSGRARRSAASCDRRDRSARDEALRLQGLADLLDLLLERFQRVGVVVLHCAGGPLSGLPLASRQFVSSAPSSVMTSSAFADRSDIEVPSEAKP